MTHGKLLMIIDNYKLGRTSRENVMRAVEELLAASNDGKPIVSGAELDKEAGLLYKRHYNDYHYYTPDEGFAQGIKCGCWAMNQKLKIERRQ